METSTTTQVPPVQFTPTGVSIPAEQDILTGVLADCDAAFGGGLNKDLRTPQGQLAQSLTAIIGDKNAQLLELLNQVDPARNSGRWQDAIGRIYFMTRTPGAGTVVQATCSGAVGTVIPAGSLAQDQAGYLYASTGAVTIGSNGAAAVQFQNQTDGPIACPIGSLARIYVAVTGWERVTNAAAGTPGNLVETRQAFEERRAASVAINSTSMNASLLAALWQVPGVVDVYVTDNPNDQSAAAGATNYALAPHSVYCCVAGGQADAIAKAIQSRKSGGCNMNGNTSYTITQTDGYGAPYPKYTYKWQTPAAKPIYFVVNIANNAILPSDIIEQIKAAMVAAFNGADGGARARIGAQIYASRYYCGINALSQSIQINSITVGLTSAPTTTMVSLGIDQLPTLDEHNITVLIN